MVRKEGVVLSWILTATLFQDVHAVIRTRSFEIKCCRGGHPQPASQIAQFVTNWNVTQLDNETCINYRGSYQVPEEKLLEQQGESLGVSCECPEKHLDRNCRDLPPCKNGGYRAFSINLRCACPGKFFGTECQFYCYNGERVKDNADLDFCRCSNYFGGPECNTVECLNGGSPVNSYCHCQTAYMGRHCEIPPADVPYRGSMLQRDLSGTVVSFLMVMVLMLVIYCMVRKRLASHRRSTFFGELLAMANRDRTLQTAPRELAPDGAPPPYPVAIGDAPLTDLPPLPSYDDAIKEQPVQQERPTENDAQTSTQNLETEVSPLPVAVSRSGSRNSI